MRKTSHIEWPADPMTQYYKTIGRWAFLTCLTYFPTHSQDVQFLPEVDAHLKLSSAFRTYLEAKDDRDTGAPDQFTFGPSLQFYRKPLIKLKKVTMFDLDDAKSRFLVFEAGYRYITAPNAPTDNRLLTMVTLNFPMSTGMLLSDRNRADLDWKGGGFTWRYRNRLTLERTFSIHSYHLIPYVAAEPYYESRYSKWSTTALYAGCLFPVGKHVQLNIYYEHQNNTGKSPNMPVNQVGLALYLYFSVEKN